MLALATGTSRKDTAWKNTQLSWSKLVEKLTITKRTVETVKQYKTFEEDRRANIKDVGGFVAGTLSGGNRKKENVTSRSMVTLDLDFVNSDLWGAFQLMYGCAACIYSTHSHTPEKPRLRLIIPLSRDVFPEEYEALARRIAGMLDIEACDPTTYEPSRLMYWPSTPIDGEYVFMQQEGDMLDPDEELAAYKDWRDITEWPTSSKDKKLRQHRASKIVLPTLKPGVIGAFCQTHSIPEVIELYLSDVYVPTGDPHRYTYTKGTTFGGLIVYDDELLAFSHHSTDPANTGSCCNAFDLVRLHLFGEQDADKADDVPINKLPSFLAMQDLATSDPAVKARIVINKAGEPEPGEEDEDLEWRGQLEMDRKGNILPTIANLTAILNNDFRLKGKFAYDQFAQREVIQGNLPWGTKLPGTPLQDADDANIWGYIEEKYKISNREKLHAAMQIVTRANGFHPIREYVSSVEWDGTPRIDTLFIDYLGVADTTYARIASRKFLCGGIARIFVPGIKFDTMLVLVGGQGTHKSQILDRLGSKWFSDSLDTVQGKEALEAVQGAWILEAGELTGLRKADVNKVKQFVSKRQDRFRVAYGRRVEDFPRQCIFAGTSNTYHFLRDQTGNRRFWPLVTDLPRATRNVFNDLTPDEVAQVWAEAKLAWEAGEPLYLSGNELSDALTVQAHHTEEDERLGMILNFLDMSLPPNWGRMGLFERRGFLQSDDVEVGDDFAVRTQVCISELWFEALSGRTDTVPKNESADLHEIMQKMPGWKRMSCKARFGRYGVLSGYERILQPTNTTPKAAEAAFLN